MLLKALKCSFFVARQAGECLYRVFVCDSSNPSNVRYPQRQGKLYSCDADIPKLKQAS